MPLSTVQKATIADLIHKSKIFPNFTVSYGVLVVWQYADSPFYCYTSDAVKNGPIFFTLLSAAARSPKNRGP